MSVKSLRRIALFWTLFIGIGAVAGAIGMFADPSGKALGMDAFLIYFKKLPFADVLFKDLLFSGISLLIVNGVTQLITALLLFLRHPLGAKCTMGCGILLMLWICIQFYMFPLNFMSTIYFFFGLAEAVTGWFLIKKEKA